MQTTSSLQRFLDAQQASYSTALSEIRRGRKQSHWMWYIFPQMQGLGISATSKFYAIKDLAEAEAFLNHPVLGQRLIEISTVLLALDDANAHRIFGSPDDMKLKSSMTLFAAVMPANTVFRQVLDKFFQGGKDAKTMNILNGHS